MQERETIAGRFEIERQAGSGGMGIVFRAHDRFTGEPVAVKVLRPNDPSDVERFLREARVLSELRHPAIVRYVAHGRAETGALYIAMEWLEGHDLSAMMPKRGMPLAQVVALLKRVAGALAKAHEKGVVHRDVKPSNLFLLGDDPAKTTVLDFGVARLAGVSTTRSGLVIGTPGYMSPEQAKGAPGVDARSDVFSLGCVAFECLTGVPPFAGEHAMAVLAKVLLEDAPRLGSFRADVPPSLDTLILRMLAKDPDGRPANSAEVSEALESIESTSLHRSADRFVAEPGARHRVQPKVNDTESIASIASSAVGPIAPSITGGEIHLFSIVLARAEGEEHPALAATLTPEQVSSALVQARLEVGALGGRIEKLIDGSILATLSSTTAKGAANDRAAVAARLALSMRRLLPRASIALGTGRGAIAERMLVGAVVNRTASMLARAHPGADIRLDDVTAGLLDPRFEVGGDAEGLVLRCERERIDFTRTVLGRATPCFGRERELALLASLFDESVSDSVARVVLVTGPSGIGKSRVRHELQEVVGDLAEIWVGRGDVMSRGSPFGLIAPALRRAAKIRDGEPLEVRQRKLRARVACSVAPADQERVTAFLGELIGTPHDDASFVALRSARADAMLMGDQMRRAWEDFLLAETNARPVLIIIEDLHWGDLPSVKVIDQALRNLREQPWMVLAIARPEVHELFPDLWKGRGVLEIRLGELTRRASEKLVRSVLGEQVESARMAGILERAAGNPLFLEEIVRAVAAGKGDELPESVIAMLQTRLEALDPETRRILRAASVYGQVFCEGGVASLVAGEDSSPAIAFVRDHLSVLVDREVIARVGPGRFADQEYAFHHSAVRDAAYAMLTEQDRALAHRLAGEWLERAGEPEVVVLAEHYERGRDPARAVKWYRIAAEHALEGNDFVATISRAEHGLACGATGIARGELRALQAEAHSWRGEHLLGERCAIEAVSELPRGSEAWFVAAAELATTSQRLGHVDRLEALAEEMRTLWASEPATARRAVALVRTAAQLLFAGCRPLADVLLDLATSAGTIADDPGVCGWVGAVRAIRETLAGNFESYLLQMQAAVAHYERAHDVRNVCMQRANVGYGFMVMGLYARAEHAYRETIAEADRMALSNVATAARTNLGLVLARRGNLAEGLAIEREVAELLAHQGDRRMEGSARTYVAFMLVLSGAFEDAAREAEHAAEVLRDTPPLRSYALAVLAKAALATGRVQVALQRAGEAMDLLRSLGGLDDGESFVRLTYAEALLASGDRESAGAALVEARDRLTSRAQTIVDPLLRRSFLEDVPDHALTIALASKIAVEFSGP